jgi:hypothetical protein
MASKLRQMFRDLVPRSVRQSGKDWLNVTYPGMEVGQTSSDLGYNDPSRQKSVYDPINGKGYAATPAQTNSGPAIYPQKPEGYVDPNARQYSTAGASGGGTPAPDPIPEPVYVPNNQTFLGQTFDLNSPEGLLNYLNAKKSYIDTTNRDLLGQIDTNFKKFTGGTDRNVNIGNVGGSLGTQKTNFLQSIADALQTYASGQNRDMGDINAYYGGMGDVTQSSQGVRQSNTVQDYNQAIGKTNTSKTQGMGSLETALSDYLGQDTQQRNQVAQQYQGAQDELANQVNTDVQAKMQVPITLAEQYQGVAPTAYQGQIDRNQSLLSSLQGAGNMFKNFGQSNGGENIAAILKYLYGQGG